MSKKKKPRVGLKQLLTSTMDGLPIHDSRAVEDAHVYLCLSKDQLNKLPAFTTDGEVAFYEIGGVLLGKSALLKFVETIKNK